MADDHIYSATLTRARVRRALANLDEEPLKTIVTQGGMTDVFFSRLIIALNTIASDLSMVTASEEVVEHSIVHNSADLLWQIGEEVSRLAPSFHTLDAARPQSQRSIDLRHSFRPPINAIFEAAWVLNEAANAIIKGEDGQAINLLLQADDRRIWKWTDSIWGKLDPNVHMFSYLVDSPPRYRIGERPTPRMPTADVRKKVIDRDGYACRFCGIPVIPREVRAKLNSMYPDAAKWGPKNADQHAAFQCMWLQFDHVLPNARGGESSVDNIIVTCAPCNFGRMDWTVEEAGLVDPRTRLPIEPWCKLDYWDGLIRLLT